MLLRLRQWCGRAKSVGSRALSQYSSKKCRMNGRMGRKEISTMSTNEWRVSIERFTLEKRSSFTNEAAGFHFTVVQQVVQ
jgi:hypothetical protein